MKLVSRIFRSLPLLALLFVLGFSLVYALAWIQLYLQPHPYRAASEWIFANIPQGSVLAGPHWDDRLPISIPGKDAPRYFVMEGKDAELPFYERDTREKLNIVVRRMAKADYIIFPTARIADSIPRVPEEYPYTNALLQLLWSEKLGFSFEKSIKDRPTFLGFTFNDDLADESLSVYDHPKAVIFKNKERLTEEQMRERVFNAERYEPLPNINEMLLMDQGGWAATATVYDPNPRRLVVTFVMLVALGMSAWVLFGSLLTFLPDRGLGLGFLGGVLLSGGLTWAVAALRILPFNAVSATTFVALVIGAALIRLGSSRGARGVCGDVVVRHGANVLLCLFAGVAIVLATKALYPSYFWGAGDFEKFALAFFSRNETIPPSAGWSPVPEHSHFYGMHLLSGWLVKLVGASGSFAYELCFVMLGGAVGGVLYSIVLLFMRRPLHSVVIALILIAPVIRGIHVIYNGYSGLDVALAEKDLSPNQERLIGWLSKEIKGAPVVVEACDVTASQHVASKAGLPTFKGEAAQSICSLTDPESAFKAMMSNDVALLIVSGGDGEVPAARQELLAKFTGRPELFASVYSDGGSMVLAPAFSKYFPRAFNKVAEPE
jgi:hypothetical protein